MPQGFATVSVSKVDTTPIKKNHEPRRMADSESHRLSEVSIHL